MYFGKKYVEFNLIINIIMNLHVFIGALTNECIFFSAIQLKISSVLNLMHLGLLCDYIF